MKTTILISFLFFTQLVIAQKSPVNYNAIDGHVARVNANSVSLLSQKLTNPYKTDLEKTRAIFSWIAQNIRYYHRPSRVQHARTGQVHPVDEVEDTSSELRPVNHIIAENVLRKRTAICDGYARLFKTLCDYAGVQSEIINGYARNDMNRIGRNFKSNHSWNAVKLDSTWHLIDVTWASGYLLISTNEFIAHYDDKYFLASPEEFALDHFPEDPQWTLLPQPPVMKEFQYSPFKGWSVIKYKINSYTPSNGIIRAAVGDTVQLQLQITEEKERKVGGGYFTDSMALTLPGTVFLKPDSLSKDQINYSFIIKTPTVQWVQLVYNDDLILRYKLEVR